MKYNLVPFLLIFLLVRPAFSQDVLPDSVAVISYLKNENISGAVISGRPEREELRTDFSVENEETFTGAVKYRFGKRYWEMLPFQQQIVALFLETGPLAGSGNWKDSSKVREILADHTILGWRTNLAADYSNRYYFDMLNYTLVELNAWGRYDIYRQNSEGTVVDSNGVRSSYDDKITSDKLRFGFEAKAGWGFGRLNPVNHYMISEYILEKYYSGRVFTDDEILQLALEIAQIKHRRHLNSASLAKTEVQELTQYLKTKLMLKAPEGVENEWQLGEFLPRHNGNRLEIGPFFNYYNREPDFIYGGFIRFENAKYIDWQKNRDFSAALSYNRYKTSNWLLLETDLSWSFYSGLKSRFTAGLRYMPGITITDIENFGPLIHNFMPYAEYFTQMNSKMRMDVALAWNFNDDEKFIQAGPRFLLTIYRSRY